MIDSHCHIDFPEFDGDRAEVWRDCRASGVRGLLIPGTEPTQWERASALCKDHENWRYSAGIHPWYLPNSNIGHNGVYDNLELLESELGNEYCVALGECGLDGIYAKRRGENHFDWQIRWFEAQVALAYEKNTPLIIHAVKAHHEVIAVLKRIKPSAAGVIHGFSGSKELAQAYWKLGFFLGIGATVTYTRAAKIREALKHMPIEALLLETDAPSMPLSGRQGQRNSPAYLSEIALAVAKIKGVTLKELSDRTSENFNTLFNFAH